MSVAATPPRGAVLGTTTLGGLRTAAAICAIAAVVVVVAAASSAAFRTTTNVQSLLFAMAPLLIVAAGQAIVVLTAGIDLSVGSMIGLATVVAASGATITEPALLVVVLLLVGLAGGLINGGGVLLGVNPLVMTLATMAVFKGVALLVLEEPGGLVPEPLLTPLTTVFGNTVPLTFLVALGIVALLWAMTSETRWGRLLYALGEEPRHVQRMRLPWRRALLAAYAVCGLCAAVAGLALVARIYSGDALVGEPYALDSITAAVIGGIAVTGGRGSVLAVVPAVVLLALIDNLLNLSGVSSYWQLIAKGAILVVTLWAYHAGGSRPALLRRQGKGATA